MSTTEPTPAAPSGTPLDDLVITLQSEEGEELKVKAKFAFMSKHIKTMIEDTGPDDVVPIPGVYAAVLLKVMDYCTHHYDNPGREIEKPLKSRDLNQVVDEWDGKYINLHQKMLIDLINAANYLDIPPLLDLACAKIASMIHGKSVEEIRQMLDITNDFTPEEEAKIREENKWCEEE